MSTVNLEASKLYQSLQNLQIDAPDTEFTFAKRLAAENAWSLEYAERVVQEYKRFLLLAAHSLEPISPSDAVDQAWHLHMIYSRSYWEDLCRDILGKPLHHDPMEGGGKDKPQFMQQYAAALRHYQLTFAETPPADIWPSADKRFASNPQFQRIDMRLYKPKSTFSLGAALAALSVIGLGFWFSPIVGVMAIFFSGIVYAGVSGSTSGGGGGCSSGSTGGCGGGGCGGGGCGGGCGGG